jgi:hypothetical protein
MSRRAGADRTERRATARGRLAAAVLGGLLVAAPSVFTSARAENSMGYRLLTQEQAEALPRNNGALGMDVERGRQITDHDMTFEIMRVTSVRQGSTAARAGLRVGDQIIAIDGRVFPSLRAFALYVGSLSPGQPIDIDYMPAGGGPQQAQRASAVIGTRTGRDTRSDAEPPRPPGMVRAATALRTTGPGCPAAASSGRAG